MERGGGLLLGSTLNGNIPHSVCATPAIILPEKALVCGWAREMHTMGEASSWLRNGRGPASHSVGRQWGRLQPSTAPCPQTPGRAAHASGWAGAVAEVPGAGRGPRRRSGRFRPTSHGPNPQEPASDTTRWWLEVGNWQPANRMTTGLYSGGGVQLPSPRRPQATVLLGLRQRGRWLWPVVEGGASLRHRSLGPMGVQQAKWS